ncbi:MAG: hypothetical protein ABFE01_26100 [Phycisphaerales bacterium]
MPLLMPSKPAFPHVERLIWRTQINRGNDGSEQRVALRKVPRQILEYSFPFASDAEVAALDNRLHAYAKGIWYVPLWGQQVGHTATLTAGATAIAFSTTYGDWRSSGGGAYAVIWQSAAKHEVVTVSAVTAAGLTVSPLVNTYTGFKLVAPCRTGYLVGAVAKRRHGTGVAFLDAAWEVIDNQYVSGHTAVLSRDNCEVLTIPAGVPAGIYEQQIEHDCEEIDSATGRRVLLDVTEFNRSTQSHQFTNLTRAECWWFRRWLHAVNGPQKSFLVPTFRDDLVLAGDYSESDRTVTVVNRGFTDYMALNTMRDYVAFWIESTSTSGIALPTGGLPLGGLPDYGIPGVESGAVVPIVRRVDAMEEVSASTERITIDEAVGWPVAAGASLSWVDRCRIADDAVTIEWLRPDVQKVELQVSRVRNNILVGGNEVPGIGIAGVAAV